MIPYTWVHNFMRGFIPVFILIFLNARIINVLRKERVKGKKFSSRNRITLMLIAMIVIFIVCITPDAFMSTFFGKGYVEESPMGKGIREITDALVTFNSAVNFILYCSLSAVFRNTFARVFLGSKFVSPRNISRRASNYTVAEGPHQNSSRRKGQNRKESIVRSGYRHSDSDSDKSQDSPLQKSSSKKRKQSLLSFKHSNSKQGSSKKNNNNGAGNPQNNIPATLSNVENDRNTEFGYDQCGGVWLGPIKDDFMLNSSGCRTTATSSLPTTTNINEQNPTCETVSEHPAQREASSQTSGCYTLVGMSDKSMSSNDNNDPSLVSSTHENHLQSKRQYSQQPLIRDETIPLRTRSFGSIGSSSNDSRKSSPIWSRRSQSNPNSLKQIDDVADVNSDFSDPDHFNKSASNSWTKDSQLTIEQPLLKSHSNDHAVAIV